jgi:hypothetical protein
MCAMLMSSNAVDQVLRWKFSHRGWENFQLDPIHDTTQPLPLSIRQAMARRVLQMLTDMNEEGRCMPTSSRTDWHRSLHHPRPLLLNTAAALALAACATSGPTVARGEFEATYRCQNENVESRPDLDPFAVEVVGCGNDVIYVCAAGISNDAVDIAPSCRATTWCARPGCATDESSVARDVFAKDASCPIGRVTADRVANPDRPPAEVSRDPLRLEMWRGNEQQRARSLVFVAAHGCGLQTTYECVERPRQSPSCSRMTPS